MNPGISIHDVFCYRRHGYIPRAVVPKEHVRGEWVVCPRCALGADPDPQCLREIHWAKIVEEEVPTKTGRTLAFLNERLRETANKTKDARWGYLVPIIGSAKKDLADVRKRDELRREQDKLAKVEGHADYEQKLADAVVTDIIRRRYFKRLSRTF